MSTDPAIVLLERVRALATEPARSRIARYVAILGATPEARRPIVAGAIREVEPALGHVLLRVAHLAKATPWPRIPSSLAARLILGERPVDLAPGLTAREAHAWLMDGAPDLAMWVLVRIPDHPPGSTYHPKVALWLRDRWRSPDQRAALTAHRSEILAGQAIEGTYLDRLDELRPGDLRPSVEATYRRAAERLRKAMERALLSRGEPLRAPPKWWRPARCARLILTGPDLVTEGRALHHCVGVYAEAVRSGRSVIVGLCVLGQRSTVEIDPTTLAIRQHRGIGNGPPPALCERALVTLHRRWKAAHSSPDVPCVETHP